jgi:hypothetical protein
VVGLVAAVTQGDLLIILVLEASSAEAGGTVPAIQIVLLPERDLARPQAPDVVELVRAVRVAAHYELLVIILARATVLAQLGQGGRVQVRLVVFLHAWHRAPLSLFCYLNSAGDFGRLCFLDDLELVTQWTITMQAVMVGIIILGA